MSPWGHRSCWRSSTCKGVLAHVFTYVFVGQAHPNIYWTPTVYQAPSIHRGVTQPGPGKSLAPERQRKRDREREDRHRVTWVSTTTGKNPKGHHHDMLSLYQAFLFALPASSCLAFYQLNCILFILLPAPANLAFIVYLYYLSDQGVTLIFLTCTLDSKHKDDQ